jgi:uncharacterized membrane protein
MTFEEISGCSMSQTSWEIELNNILNDNLFYQFTSSSEVKKVEIIWKIKVVHTIKFSLTHIIYLLNY